MKRVPVHAMPSSWPSVTAACSATGRQPLLVGRLVPWDGIEVGGVVAARVGSTDGEPRADATGRPVAVGSVVGLLDTWAGVQADVSTMTSPRPISLRPARGIAGPPWF